LGSWERYAANFLHVFRLDSIKRRILVFALLATLVPSLTTTWLSYVHNRRALTEKITAELKNISRHGARVTDLWLKERFYELRVFAGSFVVRENLDRTVRALRRGAADTEAARRLDDYLTSVRDRTRDYEHLSILTPDGAVAASTALPEELELPEEWLSRVGEEDEVRGQVYWDDALDQVAMTIVVPIDDGGFLRGALAAKVTFPAIDAALRDVMPGATGHVYLIRRDGTIIVSSRLVPAGLIRTQLTPSIARALFAMQGSGSLEYIDPLGNEVVGTLDPVPQPDWAVVAEITTEEAFVQIAELRNQTVMVVSTLLLSIGLLAYVLVLLIVRPLNRLTAGAARVAGGDLEVDLPVVTRGELGYLTEVFNAMVGRLRSGREELEKLSVTDGLTGLFNRDHLMVTVTMEIARADRQETPFTVLMIDLDHFKKYNDTHGHLAGDEVLAKIGAVFSDCTREVDYAARYGGEEFLVLLPQTGTVGATEVAERIRARFAEEAVQASDGVFVTLSIGLAEYPQHGDTAESIIAAADAALYRAKRGGRNRVVAASVRKSKTTPRARGKSARGKSSKRKGS
jgi:diguanylate cyclase (GGDEF)-like protein